jgi:hypothetical protein
MPTPDETSSAATSKFEVVNCFGCGHQGNPSKFNFGQLKHNHIEQFQMGTKNYNFPKSHECGPFDPNGTKWILSGPIGGLGNPIEEIRNPGTQTDLLTIKKVWLSPMTDSHEPRIESHGMTVCGHQIRLSSEDLIIT